MENSGQLYTWRNGDPYGDVLTKVMMFFRVRHDRNVITTGYSISVATVFPGGKRERNISIKAA